MEYTLTLIVSEEGKKSAEAKTFLSFPVESHFASTTSVANALAQLLSVLLGDALTHFRENNYGTPDEEDGNVFYKEDVETKGVDKVGNNV